MRASDKADERKLIIEALAIDKPYSGVVILDPNGSPICDYGNAADLLQCASGRGSLAGPLGLPREITERCDRVKRALCLHRGKEVHEKFRIEKPGGEFLNVHLHPYDCGERGLRFLVYVGAGQADIVKHEQLERFKLTTRQIDIVKLVCLGMTNPEIADRLCISARTVQNHLRSLYVEVNVHNRTSLVIELARP